MSTILTALAVLAAATPGLLISPAELASALKDPATVVIAVGNSEDDFIAGHIPGARFVRYDDIAIDANGLSSELPPVDQLRKVLAAAGISDKSKVTIYGSAIAATRMFFTLDYFGHPNARVLNGGLNAWKANGGAVEIAPPSREGLRGTGAGTTLTPKPNPDRVVSAEWIKERLSSRNMTLLDARPDAEFTGADGGMNGAHVKGHLPDAQQLVWNTLLDANGKFLPDVELRKKFDAIGANKTTPLVSYCMVGMRASVTYFVARHLGYDARLYDGSIVDWSRRKFPAVMGPR
ncbi:MAG TPA: rhodanese-like domain-containing protein [Vicinamibacterales bacterium]|nr:rhodanese-like domain-containing protein [Vicinamibacterales bacterium]